MSWLLTNWDAVAGIAALAVALATAVSRLTPTPKDDEVLKKVVGALSILTHRDRPSSLKLPLKSQPKIPHPPHTDDLPDE